MHWYCESCRRFFDVADRTVAAHLELDRMRVGHEAWHREMAVVTAEGFVI